MNKDAKIGFVAVLIVAACMLYNSFRESGITLFSDKVSLLFTQVHGLRKGDIVTIGGVPAGRVVDIDFAPDEIQDSFTPITGGTTLVRALVELGGRHIPKESTYQVRVDLNGRRWLDITLSPSAEMIGPSDNFFAEEAFGQDDQMQRTLTAFKTLAESTEELRAQLTAPEFQLRTKDTASNLRFYSRELLAASGKAPEQLEAFDKSLNRQERILLQRVMEFDKKTQEVARRMTEMAPQLSENLQGWSKRMERQADRLESTLQMAEAKSEEYQKLLDDAILAKLKPEVTERLIKQTRRWARRLEEYRYLAEDLHSLTSDPTIRADLKKAIDDFRVRSDKLNKRLQRLEETLRSNPLTNGMVKEDELE